MIRLANYFESRLGRNDGNPIYVQACLKRMQLYGSAASGRPLDESCKGYFVTDQKGKDLVIKSDSYAYDAAKKLWDEHKETIEIDHLYPTGEINAFGTYDLNLHVDWGEDGLKGVLPYEPIQTPHPMAYWASDTHLGYDYRLSMARKADFVFCAQKRACQEMERDGVRNPIWLPHAFEPQAYPKTELITKKYDVCFVGHVNSVNREQALDRLFREFPNFYYGQALFEDAARKFGESKIVFNISMLDDLNMRVFEVLGSGSFLLTNWIPTIEEVFEDGKHLVLYKTLDEMVEKAKYYLDHEEERNKIAEAGYQEAISKHKIQDRINVVVGEFMNSRKAVPVGA